MANDGLIPCGAVVLESDLSDDCDGDRRTLVLSDSSGILEHERDGRQSSMAPSDAWMWVDALTASPLRGTSVEE